ncbi:MAG: DUF6279 family lipoprotein [Pseudomonadota bacterium]
MSLLTIRCIKFLSLLSVAVFGLSACTSGLLARNLDWLVERYVDDYFDLSDQQSELLSALVDDSTQRSANNSMPAVITLVDTAVSLLNDDELSRELPTLAEELDALGHRFSEDNRDNLIHFALTIDDFQRQQIAEQLQHRNDKYIKKHITPGEKARRKAFSKDVQRNAKRWLGRLSDQQKMLQQAFLQQYRLDESLWLESREAWQQQFLQTLALPDEEQKKQRLTILIDNPEASFSAKQISNSEFNNELSIKFLQSLIDTSSAQQKEKIRAQLMKLRKRVSGFQQAISFLPYQHHSSVYAFNAR